MARQTQTPPVVQAFIAAFLIASSAIVLAVGGYVFYHSLTHPQREPDYIYEPKPVRKYP